MFKMIRNTVNHFSTITRHKILVGRLCFRCGLYRQGLMHDLSKYSPSEFFMGVKYYQGDRSPNDAEREAKGVTTAWLHHKGRNKHHLEYWVDYDVKHKTRGMTGMKMPDNYIVEMFCDRIAASKIYKGSDYTDSSALEYFRNGKGKTMLHPYSEAKLELLLKKLADEGEEAAFAYAGRYIRAYRRYRLKKFVEALLRLMPPGV